MTRARKYRSDGEKNVHTTSAAGFGCGVGVAVGGGEATVVVAAVDVDCARVPVENGAGSESPPQATTAPPKNVMTASAVAGRKYPKPTICLTPTLCEST